jgi:hypothetical protein
LDTRRDAITRIFESTIQEARRVQTLAEAS